MGGSVGAVGLDVTPNSNPVWGSSAADVRTIRIGTKNFTEQLILGELMAQLIENRTDLSVARRFNLGGTMICHGALESGEIDLYAEYTGTALTAILKQPVIRDPNLALETVDRAYRQRFAAQWLQPFGFNNTYAITVRKSDAVSHHLRTISDLAVVSDTLRAGFTAEFSQRPDGYPGLRRTYGLGFREVRDLDPSILYQAIANSWRIISKRFLDAGRPTTVRPANGRTGCGLTDSPPDGLHDAAVGAGQPDIGRRPRGCGGCRC
jgi:glycine betaine/choline ABC-type transport system substrate-binding protein